MRLLLIVFMSTLVSISSANAENGLIIVKSAHNVQMTANRLSKHLDNKGMKVFARIDHAEGAEKVGKNLRPTELFIFGNPKVGTPLMQCQQSIAIDLPQKMLIWEDDAGQAWLTYNDPAYIAQRHNIKDCKAVIGKINNALNSFAIAATKP